MMANSSSDSECYEGDAGWLVFPTLVSVLGLKRRSAGQRTCVFVVAALRNAIAMLRPEPHPAHPLIIRHSIFYPQPQFSTQVLSKLFLPLDLLILEHQP